jgi:hypothetical protein
MDSWTEETDLKCHYKSNDDKAHGDIKYFTTLCDYEIFTGIIEMIFAVHLKHSSFLAFGLKLMFSLWQIVLWICPSSVCRLFLSMCKLQSLLTTLIPKR